MHRNVNMQSRYYPLLAFFLFITPARGFAESATDLAGQLSDLAGKHGIAIKNLDYIEPAPAMPVQGNLQEQLKALLKDYNYVLLNGENGAIEKIIISSAKSYAPRPVVAINNPSDDPLQFKISTTRSGPHHVVQTMLTGSGGTSLEASLIVDTGASTVVLPLSQKDTLGFSERDLHAGLSDTANGQIETLHGTLTSVRIGDAVVNDVAVSFIADEKLQNKGLLGMSFLNRFRFMFDDAKNELVLIPARPDRPTAK